MTLLVSLTLTFTTPFKLTKITSNFCGSGWVTQLEKVFSMAWKDKRGLLNPDENGEQKENAEGEEGQDDKAKKAEKEDINDALVDDERGLQRRHIVDTTLLVHFFGPKGKREIRYEDFKK